MNKRYYGPVRCDHLHYYGDPVHVMRALNIGLAEAELKIWEWARLDFQIEQVDNEIEQVGREIKQLTREIEKLEAEIGELCSNF